MARLQHYKNLIMKTHISNNNLLTILLFLSLLIFPFHATDGQITGKFDLPSWVSDNMIFPSGISWKLPGSCGSLQEISVSFGEIKLSTKADKKGLWEINFPPVSPGISDDLVFTCNGETKVIKNALSGNIWLCAGQSNMEVTVSFSAEASQAGNDIFSLDIRYFNGNQWVKVTDKNVRDISAVALFFAVEMEKSQKIPVGIFVAARGGTGIEAWIPESAFPDNERGRRYRTLANDPLVLKAAQEDKADLKLYGQHRLAKWGLARAVPASLFNEFVRPFGQMPLTGVVWYQGESNAESMDQATEYRIWLENLIISYRKLFNNPALPFAIIQLPDYEAATPEANKAWTTVRDIQKAVVNNTKQAVLVDIKDLGDANNLHPRRKKEVGIRTAAAVQQILCTTIDLDIVYIGNSITYGETLENKKQEAPPAVASELLRQKEEINSVSFSNQGNSGFTTVDYLPEGKTFSDVVKAAGELHTNPSHILIFSIMLGANDSAITGPHGAPVSKEDYIQNLKTIVDELLKLFPDSKVILQQPIWYSPNFQNPGATYLTEGLNRLESYIPEIELLVKSYKEEGRVYLGDKEGFAYFKNNHLTDMTPEKWTQGVYYAHPNKKGAAALASFWAQVIYKVLKNS